MKAVFEAIVWLFVGPLLLMPAYYAGAKLVRAKRLSFGATFLLLLIIGVVLQVYVLVFPAIPAMKSGWLDFALPLCLYALISGFIFGYLVRNENNKSIGIAKGMALSFVFFFVGALILPVLLVVVAGVMSLVS